MSVFQLTVLATFASVVGAIAAIAQLWFLSRRQKTLQEVADAMHATRAQELRVLLRNPDSYVDLRLVVRPETGEPHSRSRLQKETVRGTRLSEMMATSEHCVLLVGSAGSGKSLLLRRSVARMPGQRLTREHRSYDFFSLSNWSSGRKQPLEVWIAEQVAHRWRVDQDKVLQLIRQGALVPIIEDADSLPSELAPLIVAQLNELAVTIPGMVVALREAPPESAWSRLVRSVTIEIEPLNARESRQLARAAGADTESWESLLRTNGAGESSLSWLFSSPLWLSLALRCIDEPQRLTQFQDARAVRHFLWSRRIEDALVRGQEFSVRGTPKHGTALLWRWLSTLAKAANQYPAKEISSSVLLFATVKAAGEYRIMVTAIVPLLFAAFAAEGLLTTWQFALWIAGTFFVAQHLISGVAIKRYYAARAPAIESNLFWLELFFGLVVVFASATLIVSRGGTLSGGLGFGFWVTLGAAWRRWITLSLARLGGYSRALLPLRVEPFLRWCAHPEIQLMVKLPGAYKFVHSELLEVLVTYRVPLKAPVQPAP